MRELSILISESLYFIGPLLKLLIFLANGNFKSLILTIVDVDGHLYFLLSVNFILLVVVNNFLSFALGLFELLSQFADRGFINIFFLFGMMLVIHKKYLYFLLKLIDLSGLGIS